MTKTLLPRSASFERCSPRHGTGDRRRTCGTANGCSRYLSHRLGVHRFQGLFAALELDLFSRLLEPKTIDAVARESGIPAHRVKTLLATLTALGLIVRDDDRFRNSAASERYLARISPASFGEYYRLQINHQAYPR